MSPQPSPEQLAGYVDAAAVVAGLSIEPYRDGVLRYFALAASMNAIIDAYPLVVHDESGEVFEPVSPTLRGSTDS